MDTPKTCPVCGSQVVERQATCPFCHAPLDAVERPRVTFRARLWRLVALGGLVALAAWAYRRQR